MPLAPSSRAAKVAVVAALAASVPLVSAETATSRPRRALLQTAAEIGAAVEDAAYAVGDAVTGVYDAVVDVVEAPAEAPMPDVGRRRALLDMHEFPPVEEEEDWSAMPTSMPMPPAEEDASMMMMPPAEAPAMPDYRRRALLDEGAMYDEAMPMPMPPAEAPMPDAARRRALLQDDYLDYVALGAAAPAPAPAA
jgi:hypothetical protein